MESATENSKSILKSGSSSEEKSMLLDDPEPKANCKGGDPIIYVDASSIYEPDLTQEDKFAASPTILLDKFNSSELKHQTATTPLEAKQTKENVAPEPDLELKEISSDESEEMSSEQFEDMSSCLRARRCDGLSDPFLEDHEVFIVKQVNGISDVRIHKQEAVCRHCSKLMSEDSDVLKAECECTKFSLVLRECPKQNKCGNCDQQIKYTSVSLSTVPPEEENPKTRIRFGCFGFTK